MEIKDKIIDAIKANDKEKLKELQDEISRDKWLKDWRARGSNMGDWIKLDNPFVRFVETK
ncbi:hypothetical protein ACTHQF_06640 [Pedobacter sp. SAFR-022]|uniref:hypothetical protein n=1 Tax=Pedobacter sp. SAFR-022 TaxID=3436861 RepID=UPI003F7FB11C